MSFFSNAQNFEINNGHFTVNHSTSPSGIDILFEASIPEATHDSSARHPPPRCFRGTREQYIEDIINWALPAAGDTPLPIYWMKGPAGVGKSAVAQTCAEQLKRQRKLGATFFFSINRCSKNNNISANNRGEHYKFFTSIAYQLSTVYPNYRNLLDAKIRHDRSLIDKTMESQFWELIVEPLQELEEKGLGIGKKIPIFVDGLDECESREAQCEIVDIVASAVRDGVAPLCWAFFSRPEPHIEATFSNASISPLCCKVILPVSRDADRDIELYLEDGFKNILRRLNVIIASPWPSDDDMQKLVHAAGGLFIYAKTVLRFVGHPDSLNPEELLHAIIAVISNREQCDRIAEPAFAELDAFYMLIMQSIPARMIPTIHRVLSALCSLSFSSALILANLVGISRVELEAACHQMGAVVHFQRQHEPLKFDPTIDTSHSILHINQGLTAEGWHTVIRSLGGSISFYHKSFQDFLMDPRRSGIYCLDTTDGLVVKRIQDVALQFEKHHFWQGSELVQASGTPNSTSSLSYLHTNELVNSFIEATLYCSFGAQSSLAGADFDFRKWLYVTTYLLGASSLNLDGVKFTKHRYASLLKSVHGTMLTWLQPGEFSKFDTAGFKKDEIETRQQENVIRPYHPTTPFLDKPHDRVESGLYTVGRDSKSYFWYWEINYDSKSFRELWMLDLDEGERLYREQFGSGVDD